MTTARIDLEKQNSASDTEAYIVIGTTDGYGIRFDLFEGYSARFVENITEESAYALVDWITENVERPRVKTDVEIAFEKLEIGTVFGFYYPYETPTRWPYKKVSETEYASISEYGDDVVTGIPRDIKDAGSGTLPIARPVKPKLTVKEQFDAFPICTSFYLTPKADDQGYDEARTIFIKTGQSSAVRLGGETFPAKFYEDLFSGGAYPHFASKIHTLDVI